MDSFDLLRWLGVLGWGGLKIAVVKLAGIHSMGRGKDFSGFVLFAKLARIHIMGRVKYYSGIVLFAKLLRMGRA